MKILAIDPGTSGGLAYHDGITCGCFAMPETEGDIIQELNSVFQQGVDVAYVEEVGGYCKGVGAPGSAMFSFGRNFGFLLGVLAANKIRVELVKPQKWQKHFGFGTVKTSGGKTPWKNKLKSKAQQLFPHLKITLKTADAVLILQYAIATNP